MGFAPFSRPNGRATPLTTFVFRLVVWTRDRRASRASGIASGGRKNPPIHFGYFAAIQLHRMLQFRQKGRKTMRRRETAPAVNSGALGGHRSKAGYRPRSRGWLACHRIARACDASRRCRSHPAYASASETPINALLIRCALNTAW
jgi:hypothetical protein